MASADDRATARAVQAKLAVALFALREAETLALTLPLDVDAETIPHITRSITDGHHALRGAFYALGSLGAAIGEVA